MTEKIISSRMEVDQSRSRPTLPNGQTRPVKLDHNNPASIEEFEREHMGIAAKE
jgi:hypothetical protein